MYAPVQAGKQNCQPVPRLLCTSYPVIRRTALSSSPFEWQKDVFFLFPLFSSISLFLCFLFLEARLLSYLLKQKVLLFATRKLYFCCRRHWIGSKAATCFFEPLPLRIQYLHVFYFAMLFSDKGNYEDIINKGNGGNGCEPVAMSVLWYPSYHGQRS
jgi:hypothetical protein